MSTQTNQLPAILRLDISREFDVILARQRARRSRGWSGSTCKIKRGSRHPSPKSCGTRFNSPVEDT